MMELDKLPSKYDVKDTEILSKIVKGFESKIVGEENNIKLLWCACISKDLPQKYRLSVIITSQSSAGKSNLVNTIIEPFKEDVIDFTDYTPAFLQRSEYMLNGKIFKMEQMERTNDKHQVSLSNLKFLLSEGKLKIGLVDTDDKGKKVPRTLVINGIPVFISTSTNHNIDPETQNRTFLMQIDESEEQTKKIASHIFKQYSTLTINDIWQKEVEELEKLANVYKGLAHQITDIIIPFGNKLLERIPIANLEIRRHLQKVLNLTSMITFIHASNRIRIRDNEGKNFFTDQWGNTENRYTYTLVAEPTDLQEALQIGGETIKQTLNKLNKSSMDIYKSFIELYHENENEGITVKDMAQKTHLSQNRARELLSQLLNSGHLTREKSAREYHYFATEKKFQDINISDIVFTKEELEQVLQKELNGHADRLEIIYPTDSVLMS